MWKLVSKEKPPMEDVLVSTPRHGYFVAWWAEDWKEWCYPGSRDVVQLSNPLDCYWQAITPLCKDNPVKE